MLRGEEFKGKERKYCIVFRIFKFRVEYVKLLVSVSFTVLYFLLRKIKIHQFV